MGAPRHLPTSAPTHWSLADVSTRSSPSEEVDQIIPYSPVPGFPIITAQRDSPLLSCPLWAPKSQHFSKGNPVGYLPPHSALPSCCWPSASAPPPFLFPLTTSKLWGPGSDPHHSPQDGDLQSALSVLHDNTGCVPETEPGGRLNIPPTISQNMSIKLCLPSILQ